MCPDQKPMHFVEVVGTRGDKVRRVIRQRLGRGAHVAGQPDTAMPDVTGFTLILSRNTSDSPALNGGAIVAKRIMEVFTGLHFSAERTRVVVGILHGRCHFQVATTLVTIGGKNDDVLEAGYVQGLGFSTRNRWFQISFRTRSLWDRERDAADSNRKASRPAVRCSYTRVALLAGCCHTPVAMQPQYGAVGGVHIYTEAVRKLFASSARVPSDSRSACSAACLAAVICNNGFSSANSLAGDDHPASCQWMALMMPPGSGSRPGCCHTGCQPSRHPADSGWS